MSRAPLAAWRGLLAAGGAPAASYAVLSRVPAPERLLEPLARVTLAREGTFDALVRPLDVSRVLGRALHEPERGQGEEPNEDVVRRAGGVMTKGSAGPTRSRELPGAAATRTDARTTAAAIEERPISRSRAIPERAGDIATATGVSKREPRAVVTSSAARPPAAPTPRGAEARRGAVARVLVDAPNGAVQRMLAGLHPPASSSAGATRTPLRASEGAEPPASDATPRIERPEWPSSNATPLLERAVARAIARRTLAAPRDEDDTARAVALARDPGARHTLGAGAPEPRPRDRLVSLTEVPSASEPATDGFRALAVRALQSSAPATSEPPRIATRLSHEVRTMSELPVDTLDARVAESLARVLEREARRHGIDIAGIGT